jgi:hypothetical protein
MRHNGEQAASCSSRRRCAGRAPRPDPEDASHLLGPLVARREGSNRTLATPSNMTVRECAGVANKLRYVACVPAIGPSSATRLSREAQCRPIETSITVTRPGRVARAP